MSTFVRGLIRFSIIDQIIAYNKTFDGKRLISFTIEEGRSPQRGRGHLFSDEPREGQGNGIPAL